jgi:hypothetical protein
MSAGCFVCGLTIKLRASFASDETKILPARVFLKFL